jgi:hypothetical protein
MRQHINICDMSQELKIYREKSFFARGTFLIRHVLLGYKRI